MKISKKVNIIYNKFLDKRKADEMEVPEECTTIFVRNLPYDSTEEEIGNVFKPCGEISSIRLVYNHHLNHFKGYYLNFI